VVFYYDPPAEGEDHLWIEVSSNAENYAVLPIPICGDAVAANPTATCVLCDRLWSPGLPTSTCP